MAFHFSSVVLVALLLRRVFAVAWAEPDAVVAVALDWGAANRDVVSIADNAKASTRFIISP